MKTVSTQFALDMNKAEAFVDLVSSTFELAKHDIKKLRSKHPVVINALDIHSKVRNLGTTADTYDGAFLTICAQFESAVCDLIEVFIGHLTTKIPIFQNLPVIIRTFYPKGCAIILSNLEQDKFKHLTQEMVLSSLASCVNCSAKKPYHFLGEAFSNHERNLSANVIDNMCQERLGLDSVWKRLARQGTLAPFLGSMNEATTEQRARETLDAAIRHRNNIIHRGKSFYHTGESEVRDYARFFTVLVGSFATVLDNFLQAS
jgi:hypothetical protein